MVYKLPMKLRLVLVFLVAAVCAAIPATVSAQSRRDGGVSFRLVSSKVSNPQGRQLTIDPDAENAVWDHCCDGGKWKIRFGWHVPREMTIGASVPIELSMKVDSYQSGGPSGFQMNVLAPDLAEALAVQAPTPGAGERRVMFAVRDYLRDRDEFSITIGFLSGGVTYTYRRQGTGEVTPMPAPRDGGVWFDLVGAKASNPQGPQLTIDTDAENAVWDHCCDGGKWKIRFGWHVPREMKVGVSYPIRLTMKVDSYQSGGSSGFQMNVLAPDLAEALAVQAPTPGAGERTVTFAMRDYLKGMAEFTITVGFVSGGVTYTYRRR